MAGLLDLFQGMDKKTALGLLMAGNQMASNRNPNGIGAIGDGLLGFAQGLLAQQDQEKQDARQAKQDERQARLDESNLALQQAQAQHYLNSGDTSSSSLQGSNMGFLVRNPQTGKHEFLQVDGKTPLPVGADINLAYQKGLAAEGVKVRDVTLPDNSVVPMQNSQIFPNMLPNSQPQPSGKMDKAEAWARFVLPSLIKTESSGNPNAVSPKGAVGLTQIMPDTGKNPGYGIEPLKDNSQEEQKRFAVDYLANAYRHFNGDTEKALSAYNQGISGVEKNGINNKDYVEKVKNGAQSPQLELGVLGGTGMAIQNGVPPKVAFEQSNAVVDNLKRSLGDAEKNFLKSPSQEQKNQWEVEKQRQIAENEANIKLAQKQGETQQKQVNSANKALGLIDQAVPLIDTATNSGAGALIDDAMGFFGKSTQGANSAQSLKALGANLVMQMPRMEGPQSDKDVQLYKEMAGQISDPWIPKARKLAAIETIKNIQQRYAGQSTPVQQTMPSNNGWSIRAVE